MPRKKDYSQFFGKLKVESLTVEQSAELHRAYVAGDKQAGQRMIESVLPLVISEAKRSCLYYDRALSMADLVQAGSMGVMKALTKFDPEIGVKFSTYAIWWIRQRIGREIAERRNTIYTPKHGYKHKRQEYTENIERANFVLSLDVLSHSKLNGEGQLKDLIVDACPPPDEVATRNETAVRVQQLMQSLLPHERRIIEMRFMEGVILQDVADQLGISRERVRQIEAKALQRMRRRAKRDRDVRVAKFQGEEPCLKPFSPQRLPQL